MEEIGCFVGADPKLDPNGISPPIVPIPISTIDEDGNPPSNEQPSILGIVLATISLI